MASLSDVTVVEFAGIGPAPFCGMMLADMGANVVRIARGVAEHPLTSSGTLNRRRREVTLDLKSAAGVAEALRMVETADALIEGFRPGVMERLGLGPAVCQPRNPRLVYGRVTGWGQTGPLAQTAGHDLNYLAISGALHAIGEAGRAPVPPLNLVADFGGGGMMLAFGVVCGILEARRTDRGRVIDAAMTDGSAALMAMTWDLFSRGLWSNQRGGNFLDGGAHFYTTYLCADGKYVAVAAIEPKFYAELRTRLALTDAEFDHQMDRDGWPRLKARLAGIFLTRTRDEWATHFAGSDACVSPVLDFEEALRHPHNVARGTFQQRGNSTEPAPAPRMM